MEGILVIIHEHEKTFYQTRPKTEPLNMGTNSKHNFCPGIPSVLGKYLWTVLVKWLKNPRTTFDQLIRKLTKHLRPLSNQQLLDFESDCYYLYCVNYDTKRFQAWSNTASQENLSTLMWDFDLGEIDSIHVVEYFTCLDILHT